MVYWTIEPPLADRIERSIAELTALMANIHRDRKKHDPFTTDDFMPKWGQPQDTTESGDGMDPGKVLTVMDGFLARQERRERMERSRRR